MLTRTQAQVKWDVVVVGAGHNGLTAAAMLATAGLATLVVERRDVIGGCCVTEEIAPGCRASTTSYIASMLRPEVIRELHLGQYGLRMIPCEPAVQVALEGGEVLAAWSDADRTAAEISRFSPADAVAFTAADLELRALAGCSRCSCACRRIRGRPACEACASWCGSAAACAVYAGPSSTD